MLLTILLWTVMIAAAIIVYGWVSSISP